ncbi:MAG: hypothetical protein ACLQFR_12065 [Streptosporangiaceae bacterium]
MRRPPGGRIRVVLVAALVRAGATFINGKLVERPEGEAAEEAQPEAALKILIHKY